MLRFLAAAFFLGLTPWAWADCTLDIETSTLDFGEHEINTGPHEIPIALTITCPAGNSWRIRALNNSVALTMVNQGSNNGSSYLLLRREDGVYMRTTSNYVEGVGTGGPQSVTIYGVLAGDSAGTGPVSRLGDFDRTVNLLGVRNNTTGYTFTATAQRSIGRVTGSCAIQSSGDVDFGVMDKQSGGVTYERFTQLSVTCTSGVGYRLYADHPTESTNTWSTGAIRPIPRFGLFFNVRPQGGTGFDSITNSLYRNYTATGTTQIYDLRVTLALEPNALGEFSVVVRPTITF